MPFAIVADLPLGTYRGARADGRPEAIPSISRLHSALLCAAGFGPRALEREHDGLDVLEADEAALRWLENNPPDSVHIPPLVVNAGSAIAYRDDGTLTKSGSAIKKLPKAPDAGTSVCGKFAWIWRDSPPESVRAAFQQLCPDVAYLGTSESPVRLTAVTEVPLEATHHLDPGAGLFAIGVTSIERPVPGRLDELSAVHRTASGTPPSAAKDRHKTDEKAMSPVPLREKVSEALYSPPPAPVTNAPWPQVITIPLISPVPDKRDRVGWATAAHRALIKIIGSGAPALITGAYPDGVRRPANRLALQFLDFREGRTASLALLVPAHPDPADLDALRRALPNLTSVRGPRGKLLRLDPDSISVADGGRFWPDPSPGTVRLWRTVPAAVPDTRGSRETEWNFTHAALLSLGFTWKDHLPKVPGRGDTRYQALAAAAAAEGAAVVHARAVRTSDAGRYVHKVNDHAVVRPYIAYLSLGNLGGPRTIQAIGQTRHLGGGLLVPFDVPEGTRAGDVVLPGRSGT